VSFFAPLARERGVAVRCDLAESDVTVHGSGDQLYQVLLNLVHNAIQAMRGAGLLTMASRRENDSVIVEVADTGPGFDEDLLPRIFSPFVTTKADGTGLGLAIAKRIIEEHGGAMGARNRPEGGALVWFRLPVKEEA
jgi:signal transduction histidine kinase